MQEMFRNFFCVDTEMIDPLVARLVASACMRPFGLFGVCNYQNCAIWWFPVAAKIVNSQH